MTLYGRVDPGITGGVGTPGRLGGQNHVPKGPTRDKPGPSSVSNAPGASASTATATPPTRPSFNLNFPGFDQSQGGTPLQKNKIPPKGYIRLMDNSTGYGNGVFNFIYNPQSVSYTSTIIQDFLEKQFRLPADHGRTIIPGTTQLQFDILIDRTFEMYSDPDHWSQGTLHDINAINIITNINGGYLASNYVRVSLGDRYPIFNGLVASCNINHQRFNNYMIPMTTTVSFGFNQLVDENDPNTMTGTKNPGGIDSLAPISQDQTDTNLYGVGAHIPDNVSRHGIT